MTEYVELEGAKKVQRRFQRMALRAVTTEGAWPRVKEIMQASERALFARFGGKYFSSGDLMTSLTEDGGHAVRDEGPDYFEYGSDLWYARFQGTRGVGKHGKPSAVLRATPATRDRVGIALLDYVFGEE